LEKKNPRISLKFRDLHRFSFLKSGATSNIKVKPQSIRLNRTLLKNSDYQSF